MIWTQHSNISFQCHHPTKHSSSSNSKNILKMYRLLCNIFSENHFNMLFFSCRLSLVKILYCYIIILLTLAQG